jgi:hypothetical protein
MIAAKNGGRLNMENKKDGRAILDLLLLFKK